MTSDMFAWFELRKRMWSKDDPGRPCWQRSGGWYDDIPLSPGKRYLTGRSRFAPCVAMLPCHFLDEGSMEVVVKLQVLDPDEHGILILEV